MTYRLLSAVACWVGRVAAHVDLWCYLRMERGKP